MLQCGSAALCGLTDVSETIRLQSLPSGNIFPYVCEDRHIGNGRVVRDVSDRTETNQGKYKNKKLIGSLAGTVC